MSLEYDGTAQSSILERIFFQEDWHTLNDVSPLQPVHDIQPLDAVDVGSLKVGCEEVLGLGIADSL